MQEAVLDAGGHRIILAHGVILANHLSGQAGARPMQPHELGLAPLGRKIVHHDRAERIDVDAAILIGGDINFVR